MGNLPLNLHETITKIVNDKIISKWKWFVTNLEGDSESQFHLVSKTYKDFSKFCFLAITKDQFSPYFNHDEHDFHVVSRTIEFIKEKYYILCTVSESDKWTKNHRRFYILSYAPKKEFRQINIATIGLPFKKDQTISICIKPLPKINERIKSPMCLETYHKIRDFIIYYINQIAIDCSQKDCASPFSRIQDRLYLARNAKDETEVREYLFGN